MARIEKTIFISYRRKDISWALAVYQYLTSHKYDVFFDFSSLSSGDFEQVIISNIRARAHFLLILTPTALDRCNEPGDWLRREIETAVDEQRNIIPLFFDGFTFGLPSVAEKLTGKIAAIKRYNGLDIPSGYFIEAMDRLSERYLNIPLDAIIHPVSTEVRKAVKQEQMAVNEAVAQKWKDLNELFKPAEEKTVQSTENVGKKLLDLRLYGIAVGILTIVVLGIIGVNAFVQGRSGSVPPTATDSIIPIAVTTEPVVLLVDTFTPEIKTSTSTLEPTSTVTEVPTLTVGSTQISSKDGMVLLYVPAGEFRMGFQGQESDEKPVHLVSLNAFWIDETEVTNAMYALCVSDGACERPGSFNSRMRPMYFGNGEFAEFPVIYVSWEDAQSYCVWADRRLPTEAEWEKAARGRDQRSYPWGEQIDCLHANYFDGAKRCTGDTASVKDYELGISPYGAFNMAGNVWEWVADWYDPDYYDISPTSNPSGPSTGELRVARGGGWEDTNFLTRSSNRGSYSPAGKTDSRGFRCALSASE